MSLDVLANYVFRVKPRLIFRRADDNGFIVKRRGE